MNEPKRLDDCLLQATTPRTFPKSGATSPPISVDCHRNERFATLKNYCNDFGNRFSPFRRRLRHGAAGNRRQRLNCISTVRPRLWARCHLLRRPPRNVFYVFACSKMIVTAMFVFKSSNVLICPVTLPVVIARARVLFRLIARGVVESKRRLARPGARRSQRGRRRRRLLRFRRLNSRALRDRA